MDGFGWKVDVAGQAASRRFGQEDHGCRVAPVVGVLDLQFRATTLEECHRRADEVIAAVQPAPEATAPDEYEAMDVKHLGLRPALWWLRALVHQDPYSVRSFQLEVGRWWTLSASGDTHESGEYVPEGRYRLSVAFRRGLLAIEPDKDLQAWATLSAYPRQR